MAQKTAAQLLAQLTTYINDNTSGDISPSDVRTMLTDIIDSMRVLSDNQTLSGIQTYTERVRYNSIRYGTETTVTLGAYNHVILTGAITTFQAQASPSNGDWYRIKNLQSTDQTLSGNGKQFVTESLANPESNLTIYAGQTVEIWYNSTSGYWFTT